MPHINESLKAAQKKIAAALHEEEWNHERFPTKSKTAKAYVLKKHKDMKLTKKEHLKYHQQHAAAAKVSKAGSPKHKHHVAMAQAHAQMHLSLA